MLRTLVQKSPSLRLTGIDTGRGEDLRLMQRSATAGIKNSAVGRAARAVVRRMRAVLATKPLSGNARHVLSDDDGDSGKQTFGSDGDLS